MNGLKRRIKAQFKSLIFGSTREATQQEIEQIETLVKNCPVPVFQALNKSLNEKGFCIGISALEEEGGS